MSRWRRQQRKRARRLREARAYPWQGGGYTYADPSAVKTALLGAGIFRDELDMLIPTQAPPSPSEFLASLERKIAEVRRMGLGPPLVPPEGVRPVLIATSDPSRFNLVFVKEENN